MNTNIFKRNFGIILQNIADQISKSVDEKLDEVQLNTQYKHARRITSPNLNQDKKYYFQEPIDNEKEKDKKSTILEPIEESHSADGTSNQISPRSAVKSDERSFQGKIPQDHASNTQISNTQQKQGNGNQGNVIYSRREKSTNDLKSPTANIKTINSPNGIKPNNSHLSRDINPQPNETRQMNRGETNSFRYDTDSSTIQKSHSVERVARSHKDKSINDIDKKSIKSRKNTSPKCFTNESSNISNVLSQKNQFSVIMSSGIDPSVLDSEFSYSQGHLFARTKRKLHEDDNKVPGPGFYEHETAENATRKKSPNGAFTRSPKLTYIDHALKQNAIDPGPIYYPTKHFLSR